MEGLDLLLNYVVCVVVIFVELLFFFMDFFELFYGVVFGGGVCFGGQYGVFGLFDEFFVFFSEGLIVFYDFGNFFVDFGFLFFEFFVLFLGVVVVIEYFGQVDDGDFGGCLCRCDECGNVKCSGNKQCFEGGFYDMGLGKGIVVVEELELGVKGKVKLIFFVVIFVCCEWDVEIEVEWSVGNEEVKIEVEVVVVVGGIEIVGFDVDEIGIVEDCEMDWVDDIQ